jgi:cytosine/adenosine deaminase-related metal-dependent hydrolase
MAKKNLKTLYDAGVKIAFGTDSGVPSRFSGYFEHRELQLMVEAGLTPMQAIVAATATNAAILKGNREFGTLERGRQADFLVLDESPLRNIRNTEKLSAVWQAGKTVPSVSVPTTSKQEWACVPGLGWPMRVNQRRFWDSTSYLLVLGPFLRTIPSWE